MWFRVQAPEKQPEEEQIETAEPIDKRKIFREIISNTGEVFDDAVFVVNAVTGLTIDCSVGALKLFDATSKEQLTGIDLTELFDPAWPSDERNAIKLGLEKSGRAKVRGIFRALNKQPFEAELQAIRTTEAGLAVISVRIYPVIRTAAPEEKIPVKGYEWFDDAGFPMAIIGPNYGFVRVNASFCRLTGYNEDELQSMSILSLIHPDDKKAEKLLLTALFRGEVPSTKSEKRMIRRSNEIVWVSTSASLSRDKEGHPKFIISMSENITQRKRIEAILYENKGKLNSLIENAEYSIVTVDRRHTIQLINKNFSTLLFTHTGIIVETGFSLLDILPQAFHKDYLEYHKKAFEGEQIIFEKTFTVNGKKSEVEIVITPVKEENGLVRNISIFGHDISDKKKNELNLIQAKEEAEASTRAKSGFLATMSHEIRTPLNGVIGMGRLLSTTPLTPKQQEFVDSILLSGDALLSVINDILDYSKIESARMELEYKPFSLKRCIEETFDLLASKAIEKNLSLQYSIARDVPSYVYGDITRVRQILMNLVSNAIKFTAKGKISINISQKNVQNNKIELRFDVKDTGIGIPADKIGKLFQSFTQAEADTSKKYGGTGLGLVICKNLVEMMHGKIWIESKEGAGSDFIFTILTEKVKQEDVPKKIKNGTNRLANSYVLIISDDRTEAALYADYFKRWGMIPQISSDTVHASDSVRQRSDFNLVMIDAQLISTNSLQLAKEIRGIRSKDDLPIVIFNAVKTEDIFFDYTSDVVSAVIPKNVDRSKVLDILISVFSVEEHQRSRDEKAIPVTSKKLADELPIRILIAEDNLVNQKLAQNIFEGFGYSPVIVSNGLQVIDQLRKASFDLIFMDVQMPEMDGFEATRFIRIKLQPTVRPVIVAMTAFALEGDKEKCIEAGMDDYISKPFLVEEIVNKIRQWGKEKPESAQIEMKETIRQQKPEGHLILNMKSIGRLKDMTAGSDPSFFSQVIEMYIKQADEQMYDIAKALSSNNWKEMASIAHKLKGSSLNLGAEAVAETCRTIELKGMENDGEGMDALVKKLAQDMILTKGELKSLN